MRKKNNVIIINKGFSFEKFVSRRCEWWLEGYNNLVM